MSRLTYEKSGVNPEKAAQLIGKLSKKLNQRPKDPNLIFGIGPFASGYSLKAITNSLEDPILITCCDGVGTKSLLALQWGELSGLGQDLVAMNVNDLLCTGAKPLLFLDYFACGELEEGQWMQILESIQTGCELAGCSLAGGETAEMPGMYANKEFDLAGFAVGMVDRRKMWGPERVKSGDVLIGIPSSGAHSNGYSLIRRLVAQEKLNPNQPTGFSKATWGEALLAPTFIYTSALQSIPEGVHSVAHITGGGLFENLPRALPKHCTAVVESKLWGDFPGIFQWISEKAELERNEILATLNCGIGMILAVTESGADPVLEHLKLHYPESRVLGKVESDPGSDPSVQWT